MSIILAASQSQSISVPPELERIIGGIFLGLTLASPVLAWAAGVFRGPGVLGPSRMEGGDSPWKLFLILLSGIVGTIFGAAIIAPFFRGMPVRQQELAVGMLAPLFALPAILMASSLLRPNGLRLMGLAAGAVPWGLIAGLVGLLIVFPWLYWLMAIVQVLLDELNLQVPTQHPIFTVWQETDPSLGFKILAFVSATIVAPIVEEVTFRGLLQTGLAWLFTPARRSTPPADASAPPSAALPASGESGMSPPVPPPPVPAQPDQAAQPTGQPRLPVLPSRPPLLRAISAPRYARWFGIITASLIFASFHRPWLTAVPIFVLALGLGYLYERTGNLWAPIFMHMFFNMFQFTIFLLVVG